MAMYNKCEEQLRPTTRALVAPYRLAVENLCERDHKDEDESSVLRDLGAAIQGGAPAPAHEGHFHDVQSDVDGEWPAEKRPSRARGARLPPISIEERRQPAMTREMYNQRRRAAPRHQPFVPRRFRPDDEDDHRMDEENIDAIGSDPDEAGTVTNASF